MRQNFMNNKKRIASVLMAGCMVGTSIVPAFAADVTAPVTATVSGIRVGIGSSVKAHNVKDIAVLNIANPSDKAVSVTWDDAAQQFVISGTKDGDELVLSWSDDNSADNAANVTVSGGKAQLKMLASYADLDAFRCWKNAGNAVQVSIPYVTVGEEDINFLFVPTGDTVTKMEAGANRIMVKGTYKEGMLNAAITGLAAGQVYDVYVGSGSDIHKMTGTYDTSKLLTISTEDLQFEKYDSETSAVIMIENAGGTKLEEYTLSNYQTLKSPIENLLLEGFIDENFSILTVAVQNDASVPEKVYIWHNDVCLGELQTKGEVTTIPNPALPVTPETPEEESKIALAEGNSLIFAYTSESPSDPVKDSIKLTIVEDAISTFSNEKLALSSSDKEVVKIPTMNIKNVMVSNGEVTMDVEATNHDQVKEMTAVHLFYDGKLLGTVPVSVVEAEKPVFTLGADKSVDLVFAYNAKATDTASDAVDIESNHQAETAKFSLRASKDSTDSLPVTFQANSTTVTITAQKSFTEGTYALFYDDNYLGDIEVHMSISEAPDTAVKVLSNSLNFEFEGDATAADKKMDKVILNITNPKNEDLSKSDFSLKVKGADGTLVDTDQVAIEDFNSTENSLTISVTRGEGDAPQFEAVIFFRGEAVNESEPINITSIALPSEDHNPYLVESIHDLVAGSYDTNDDGIPDAALPYRAEYDKNNVAQAEYIQKIVQSWIDKVAEMDDYRDWVGAKISVVYDEESEQFKSTISANGVVSSARVWNVTVASKPATENPDKGSAPTASVSKVTMNRTSKKDISLSFGSGESAATEATVTVRDSSIVSVSDNKITAENAKKGITITGLKKGSTDVVVTFNDSAKTEIVIPVKINALMYKVSASSGKNGTVTCTSTNFDGTVAEGSNLTFKIKPDSGYRVSEVLVDGKSQGSITSFTLKDIDSSHTIFAQFEKEKSDDSKDDDKNQTTKDTKPNVKHNKGGEVHVLSDNVTCLINADRGYIIKKVVANGRSVGAVDYYEFSKASADNKLEVTFEKAKVETDDKKTDTKNTTEKDPVVTVTNTGSDTTGTTSTADTGASQARFTDISGHWAQEAIEFFAQQGWVSGVSNTKFAPEMNMTRGMFVTILGRMDGGSAMTDCVFSDVDSNKYYANYVQWAFEKGIASGVGGNRFAPDANISRQEMAVMINNYLINKGAAPAAGAGSFSDESQIASWAKDAVDALAQAGFVSGKDNGRFDPKANATRAELVSILYRVNNALA